MTSQILILIVLTLLPFLELRASIPYGIFKTDLHWSLVFLVCVFFNIILAPIIYFLLDKVVHIFLKIKFIDKCWQWWVNRTQKRIKKYVDKYGELGVAVFIGIPLPGSGVYSGALGSYLIGLSYKKFIKAAIIGVLIAGVIVLVVSLTGIEVFKMFIKV